MGIKPVITLSLVSVFAISLSGCSAEMSTETAGKKYLSIVCPVNKGMSALEVAVNAEDFEGFISAAGETRDAAQAAAKSFSDLKIVWPAGLRPLIDEVKADELALASFYDSLANSTSFEQAISIPGPAVNDGSGAQEIRMKLNLSPDTVASCKDY